MLLYSILLPSFCNIISLSLIFLLRFFLIFLSFFLWFIGVFCLIFKNFFSILKKNLFLFLPFLPFLFLYLLVLCQLFSFFVCMSYVLAFNLPSYLPHLCIVACCFTTECTSAALTSPAFLWRLEVRESQPAAEKQKSEEVKETQEEQTGEVKDDGERLRLMLYQAEVELRSKAAELQRERIRCKKLEVCRWRKSRSFTTMTDDTYSKTVFVTKSEYGNDIVQKWQSDEVTCRENIFHCLTRKIPFYINCTSSSSS